MGLAFGRMKRHLLHGLPSGFLGNVAWQYAANAYLAAVGFLYSLVIGRALGPAEFGLISLALALAGVIFNVVEMRLHEAVVRYVAEFWEREDHARVLAVAKLSLLVDVGTGLLAFALVVALTPVLASQVVQDPRAVPALVLAGLSLLCSNVGSVTATGLLRIFGMLKHLALLTIGGISLKLAFVLAVLWGTDLGALGVLAASVLSSLITNVALGVIAVWALRQRVQLGTLHAPISLLRPRLREMRSFMLSTYGLSLSSIPTRDLDVTILGWFSPLEVIGAYKIAKNFMTSMWMASDPIFFVVYPEIAKLWAKRDAAGVRAFVTRLLVMLSISSGALYVVAVFAVPFAIVLLLGAEFAPAGAMFRWMVWCILIWMPCLWVNPLLMAAGLPRLSLVAGVTSSIATFALYLLLIPLWDGQGAALAYGAGVAVNVVVGLVLARRAGIMLPQEIAPPRTAPPPVAMNADQD